MDELREKVIYSIERCICHVPDACRDCSYDAGHPYNECVETMLKDVLFLLKAQEPRVMTLEEVNALDWDYCYLEQERLPGNEYRGMLGKYIMTCVTWPSITAAKISQGVDSYGKTWRCWTSRPTDAQREATPWEG